MTGPTAEPMSRLRRWVLSLCLVAVALVGMPDLLAQPITDAEVKATLLFKFVPFVRWPLKMRPNRHVFRFVILGEDPFGDAVDHFEGRKISGRRVEIVRIQTLEEFEGADMVFVGVGDEATLQQVLSTLKGRPILTVSSHEGWGDLGVMINFVEIDESVQFEINATASRAAGIKINAQLLKLARIVGS